jgi:AcrR family transcriptional regulator
MVSAETGRRRAPAMSAADRRAAIVAATLPLLAESGGSVSTSQIAAAAGIAEGTIFRVFKDKDELVWAVVERAFDTGELEARAAAISLDQPLEARLLELTGLVQRRLEAVWQLMAAMRMGAPPRREPSDGKGFWDPRAHQERDARLLHHVARLFEPDADSITCAPEHAARLLRLITFSGSHPLISQGQPLTPTEIVDLLLHGIATPHDGGR